jgi:hypothetical protein
MKRFFAVVLLALIAVPAAALQSGFVPCIEEAGRLHCFENEFTPLWNSLCPRCWIDQTIPPPAEKPSSSNAFDSCGSCHPGSANKIFSLWQTKYHKKHADKSVSCTACHKI